MSAPSRDPADADDVATLVSELETTLSRLRTELDDRDRVERRDDRSRGRDGRDSERTGSSRRPDPSRSSRSPRPPRPPAVGDLARFTSDYTIPTVVAVLEATIEALELLQGVIDLTAPGRSPDRRARRDRSGFGGRSGSILSDALADGVSSATDRATTDAADALGRLRETLSEADLPEDEASRDLVADARELSAELERRVRESRETVARERDRERRADADRVGDAATGATADAGATTDTDAGGPVTIAVDDPGESSSAGDAENTEDAAGDAVADENGKDDGEGDEPESPEVDVDAELASIKRQMGKGGDGEEPAADGDASDEGDEKGDPNAADGDAGDGS
ncbi:hypothetical protein Hbl1158_08605 [Halobaculum sp. CBA1158]|uniref:DUF7547 family protein n=1 Tax=Halobaculum sp. CBA1158 TaxID=2904243 RepID=UPI001F464CF7|nr:hypothetical protein [Halobaculum sp. CBA1158]UIO98616.1 hypothetical protein Hbl1158_08605 [Halobaculum sp. CBA1158]